MHIKIRSILYFFIYFLGYVGKHLGHTCMVHGRCYVTVRSSSIPASRSRSLSGHFQLQISKCIPSFPHVNTNFFAHPVLQGFKFLKRCSSCTNGGFLACGYTFQFFDWTLGFGQTSFVDLSFNKTITWKVKIKYCFDFGKQILVCLSSVMSRC